MAMARASVKAAIEGRDYLPPDPPAALSAPSGAFVTLKKNGVLRGCIGRLSADAPLYLAVVRMARAAAFEDPRFPPLDPAEFKDLSFEISVISPFKRIKDIAEVRVGEHGLLMRRGFRSGLLLPQVPGEWGWDRDEFLEHTCLKAGLPGDCWRDPSTEIYVFTAEVF
ncbi:MAG: AmmeMemoRadiSam system protein A [Desulfovibrionaceae bacterium]|nr:AmmeMemoRadiSam system protein A [Desulfovibrionaceae bacterium]